MKLVQNRFFIRQLKEYQLSEDFFKEILNDIFQGRSVSLGSKLYKIRAAGEGQGKRDGFRTIFFWKKEKMLVFCYLFAKGEKDNITAKEFKALKILADEYDQLSETEVKAMIQNKAFEEVAYDQTQG